MTRPILKTIVLNYGGDCGRDDKSCASKCPQLDRKCRRFPRCWSSTQATRGGL